ncbi:MAG: TonB-dependent receptor plug domain-containing protein [Gemmatimonadaceae bacterium]
MSACGVWGRWFSAAPWVVAGLLAASAPGNAQPQSVRGALLGTVLDETGRGIVGAVAIVIGSALPVETDGKGGFRLARLDTGAARVVVRRIGFKPETLAVDIDGHTPARASVTLRRVAVPLPAVRVTGREGLRGPMAGFYARQERGNGRFITQEQIARRNVGTMSELLRDIPGLRIGSPRFGVHSFRMRNSSQAPLVWLDGTPMGSSEVDLDDFDPRTFAGIEVYSGAATVPTEFSGGRMMTTSGGAILLWTKEGQAEPRRRRRQASPAVLLTRLIERQEAFTVDQVDVAAVPLDDEPLRPVYPDSLYQARADGRVEVEFLVDARGRVRMDTFGVVTTTHASLGDAVRRVLGSREYRPAMRRGVRVSQVVHLPVDFVIGSTESLPRRPE